MNINCGNMIYVYENNGVSNYIWMNKYWNIKYKSIFKKITNERIILSYVEYFVCLNESKIVIFLYFFSHIFISFDNFLRTVFLAGVRLNNYTYLIIYQSRIHADFQTDAGQVFRKKYIFFHLSKCLG